MSWKARGVLVLWILIGWSWLIFGFFGRYFGFWEDRQGRQKYGDQYGLSGDAHAAFGREAFAPENLSALTGIPVQDLKKESYCATAWTDQEQIFLYDQWRQQRTPAMGWLNVTAGGRSVTGRYGMKLRADRCNPNSQHDSDCTKVSGLHLTGKWLSSPASDEWTTILPGQCVLGQAPAAEPSVVGRYAIDLPAGRDVTVIVYTFPATLFVEARLFHLGAEVPPAPDERVVFRTREAGTHLLTLVTTADSDFTAGKGQYSLQVYWGRAVGRRCPIPTFDKRDCYGPERPGAKP